MGSGSEDRPRRRVVQRVADVPDGLAGGKPTKAAANPDSPEHVSVNQIY